VKRFAMLVVIVLAVAAVTAPQLSRAKEGSSTSKSKTAGPQYLVISPHTPEQCMKALDDVSAAGGLEKWSFGCMDGDHTGYLIVSAANAQEAMKHVPADERANARAVMLHHFTAAELKSIHEKAATGK